MELDSESNPVLAEKWRKMGSVLLSNNYPKEKISRKVRELIEAERLKILLAKGIEKSIAKKEAKFKNRWYYTVMSTDGYVDPSKQNRGGGEDDHQENTSIISKILESESYPEERVIYYEFMQDIIKEAQNIQTELKDDSKDWQPLFESPEMADSFFKLIKDMFYNEKDEWNRIHDNRQSLLPKMLIPALAFKSFVLDKYFCSKYFGEIKKETTISTKKYGHFLKDVNSLSDLLHYCKEDAWLWNFIDIDCPLCKEKSLKVRINSDGTWNFVCKNWAVHNSEKLFTPKLLGKRFEKLSYKFDAEKYIQSKGITTPTN